MSLTIRANQGNAIAADNAGIKKNESAEQIKKRNVVDARTLMIGNTTDEKINQKKNSVRNQAMKLIRDAWKSDNDSVDSRKEMEDARAQALEEARDYESKANDIEKQKKQLMEEYGIDPDSDEQKDLELLEKYQNNMSGASYDSFSDQEKERLKELQHTDFTDYQKKVLMLNSSRNSMTSVADQKKREALMYRQNLTDAKIDQLKSQDMLKAQDAADELNQAAADDAFNMLIEEGKDTIDNKTEEEKEKAEKAQEKKDEQDEKIQAAKDRKQIQEELNTQMYNIYKDHISVTLVVAANIPLMKFLNAEWYRLLTDTLVGQIIVALTFAVIFIATAYVIKVNKPVSVL